MTEITAEGVNAPTHKDNAVTRRKGCVSYVLEHNLSPRDQILRIIEVVAHAHGITADRLLSSERIREVVQARDAAILEVAETFPWLSLPHLGRIFKRDHTTILHSLRKQGASSREQWRGAGKMDLRVNALICGRLFKSLARVIS